MDDREILNTVDYMEVTQVNPRSYTIYIQVSTKAGSEISKQYK